MAAHPLINVRIEAVWSYETDKEVQAMGGGRWDTSSLLRRLQRRRD